MNRAQTCKSAKLWNNNYCEFTFWTLQYMLDSDDFSKDDISSNIRWKKSAGQTTYNFFCEIVAGLQTYLQHEA